MNNKRYYWLKLKEDFFQDKKIKKLRQLAGGDTYTIIYLKLQLLSLKNNGNLYFENIEDTFIEELALDIDEAVEDVKVCVMYLIKCGLIDEISEKEFGLVETKLCIGSETASTIRSRRCREQQRMLQCNTDATNCNGEIDIDIEKDNNINNNKINKKESDSEIITDYYQQEMGQLPSPNQYEKLYYYLDKLDVSLIKHSIDIAVNNNVKKMSYIEAILKDYVENGYKSIDDLPDFKKEPIEDDYIENEDLKELEDFNWLDGDE